MDHTPVSTLCSRVTKSHDVDWHLNGMPQAASLQSIFRILTLGVTEMLFDYVTILSSS